MAGKSEDRKPAGGPIKQHSRMDEEAQLRRTTAFMRATQGRGKPAIYGTGKTPAEQAKGAKRS